MLLPSVSFILGKREREPINPIANKDRPTARWEGHSSHHPAYMHYHNDPRDYSFRTDRDYTQAVGKLYKGR